MGKLTIQGDMKHLKVIAKENRLRFSKYGLSHQLDDGDSKSTVKDKPSKAVKDDTKVEIAKVEPPVNLASKVKVEASINLS